MLTAADFQAIISGRRRDLAARAWRVALRLAAGPYSLAMRYRNRRYDRDPAAVTRVDVPVISVGNLTLGGTGKTPLVEWLARWFRAHQVRVSLISRGYGAQAGARNDEALELEQKLPDVPHIQNPDRVAAARMAIEEFECQLILLDDAFQHRRIARDLDIVLLDAVAPFGFGYVFPRGALREPISGLKRADVIALSRADMVTPARREELRVQAARHAPEATWIEVAHAPQRLLNQRGEESPLDTLQGKRVAAFAGIGNPAGLRHTLDQCGCQVVGWREFPDHHLYQRDDMESLVQWVRESQPDLVVCTHKDLVKVGVTQLGGPPLWAVVVGMQFLSGQAELERHLLPLLPVNDESDS